MIFVPKTGVGNSRDSERSRESWINFLDDRGVAVGLPRCAWGTSKTRGVYIMAMEAAVDVDRMREREASL